MPQLLPRLPPNFATMPRRDELLQRYWQTLVEELETVPEIAAALTAAVAAAQTAADNANAAAATANTAADAVTSENSLVSSFIPATSYVGDLISADAAGNVTIVNHQRQYGDTTLNPTVSVTGATIPTTGASGDTIRVYYNDPTRAGGAVVYHYTKDPAAAPVQGGSTHSVGAVEIPAAGTQAGNHVQPPGYVQP